MLPVGGVLARGQQNRFEKGEDGGSVPWLRRWHAASPAHPLAVPVHQRVDAKAFLHRRRPSQPHGLSQPFLPQQREHGIVCLALHARREEPEVPNVVPVAVGNVIGQGGQELGRRVAGCSRPSAHLLLAPVNARCPGGGHPGTGGPRQPCDDAALHAPEPSRDGGRDQAPRSAGFGSRGGDIGETKKTRSVSC